MKRRHIAKVGEGEGERERGRRERDERERGMRERERDEKEREQAIVPSGPTAAGGAAAAAAPVRRPAVRTLREGNPTRARAHTHSSFPSYFYMYDR
jgi:hypothetical protein